MPPFSPRASRGAWSSNAGMRIVHQIVDGVGAATCVEAPSTVVRVVLSEVEMAVMNAVATFLNTLGGTSGVSIAQNIFSSTLVRQMPTLAPDVNPRASVAARGDAYSSECPTAAVGRSAAGVHSSCHLSFCTADCGWRPGVMGESDG